MRHAGAVVLVESQPRPSATTALSDQSLKLTLTFVQCAAPWGRVVAGEYYRKHLEVVSAAGEADEARL